MSTTSHDSVKAGMENLTETAGTFSKLSLDPAEEYKMNKKRRGLALIFNQKHFYTGCKPRYGTEVDRNNLEKRLKELGFEVKVYNDKTKKDVEDRIREAAEADHSDADSFLLVFLSHGEKDHIHASDDKISIQDITARFKGDKCPTLVGKPKIFILQACRGEEYDNPATACGGGESEPKEDELMVDASAIHTLPAGADFIMCYSVAEGYFSFRNVLEGSWYIQDLCKTLGEYGDSLEFTDLLTMVNRRVSMRSVEKCTDPAAIEKKQVPCFSSMLTKQLYFRPKE
ncbi:caspase-6-like [Notolabrus celidotus]|uniref:caspase-6-like n=1 Tax=Notolabrus celidotus TaxID=1203425 RepID=UPI0014908678|nr:caspase-6-like [Notolabrus celidotus]